MPTTVRPGSSGKSRSEWLVEGPNGSVCGRAASSFLLTNHWCHQAFGLQLPQLITNETWQKSQNLAANVQKRHVAL